MIKAFKLRQFSIFIVTIITVLCLSAVIVVRSVSAVPLLPTMKPMASEIRALSGQDNLAQLTDAQIKELYNIPRQKPLEALYKTRLESDDYLRYTRVFNLQKLGQWDDADEEIFQLTDYRLMGHVLYQRFMHSTDYRASYEELESWLQIYADHPNAERVYKLAKDRRPSKSVPVPRNRKIYGTAGRLDLDAGTSAVRYVSNRKRNSTKRRRVREINRSIRKDLGRDAPTRAYRRLQSAEFKKALDTVEYDSLRANIAGAYFYLGKFDKAYELSHASLKRSGVNVPYAGWIAGLTSWLKKDYKQSAEDFEQVAMSNRGSAWLMSAGAYWSSRAYIRMGKPRKSSYWLKEAAKHPYSFYGLIAARTLGKRHVKYNWSTPRLTQEHFNELMKTEAGYRAVALLDAKQYRLAERELRQVNARNNKKLQEVLVSLADHVGMPSLAMQIGSAVKRRNGDLYDVALYPLAPWTPKGGFDVDRALVYAFIRQESRFDPMVSNRSSGATGLMQLMPRTASYVAGEGRKHFSGKKGQRKLMDPILNIGLGQKYLGDLLEMSHVDSNLFKLAVAYNAGPGKLARWERKIGSKTDITDDPLLFIEMIPAAETRAFVERVVSNHWIYRIRLKQKTPSLDYVAMGKWPLYKTQDEGNIHMASTKGAYNN